MAAMTTATSSTRGKAQTDPVSVVLCVVLGILGLGYTLRGFGMFKWTLFLTGLFLGSCVILYALEVTRPFKLDSELHTSTANLGIAVLSGVAIGGLLVVFWQVGVLLIGSLGGWCIASLILTSLAVTNVTVRLCTLIACAVLGMLLVSWFERPVIIMGTALGGAWLAVVAVDLVVNSGIGYELRNPDKVVAGVLAEGTRVQIGCVVGLAVIGMVWQWCRYAGTFGGKQRRR